MAKKKEKHPTLFVFEGSIRHYEEGSMLQLESLVTQDEWELIIEETVKYKVFLDKLKDVAFPILKEVWDKEDEYFRIQLDVAVSRIRNIDPLLVAKHNTQEIGESYEKLMKTNAEEVLKLIDKVRKENKELLRAKYDMPGDNDITISSL